MIISEIPPTATPRIDDIATTQDTLTGRGGLSLFVRYLRDELLNNEIFDTL